MSPSVYNLPAAFFCAALLYSGLFIALIEAQQQQQSVEYTPDETQNLNFLFDLNDLAGGALSDLSANAFLQQRSDLVAAAGVAATPQPMRLMRLNMNSGLRRK